MYSSVRPMNRSTTSASVIDQPSSVSTATSIRTAMRSLSTSTPSQSKITSEIGALTGTRSPGGAWRRSRWGGGGPDRLRHPLARAQLFEPRTGPGGPTPPIGAPSAPPYPAPGPARSSGCRSWIVISSVGAAQLPMVPRDDARRREAEHDALGRLLEDAGARLGGQRGARVAGHQPEPELAHARGIALDRDVAFEHRAAQLAVRVASGLDLHGRARVALEVPDLLRLAVRPGQEREALAHVPERHEVGAPVRPDGRAGQHALLVEEARQLRLRHGDVAASGRHRQ